MKLSAITYFRYLQPHLLALAPKSSRRPLPTSVTYFLGSQNIPCVSCPHLYHSRPSYRSSYLKQRARILDTRRRIVAKRKEVLGKVKNLASPFKENIVTIPNLLCVIRIGLTPYVGYLVLSGNFPLACGVFAFAGLTDLLDGFIARRFPSQRSMAGSFLDPLADKFLVTTLFLTLTAVHLIPDFYQSSEAKPSLTGWLTGFFRGSAPPFWDLIEPDRVISIINRELIPPTNRHGIGISLFSLTALIVFRDVCLVLAACVIRYRSLSPPVTVTKYFDVTYASANLSPTTISKYNTGIQLLLVLSTLAAPVFGYVDHQALHYLWYATAASTLISGFSYMFQKDTYKYFRRRL